MKKNLPLSCALCVFPVDEVETLDEADAGETLRELTARDEALEEPPNFSSLLELLAGSTRQKKYTRTNLAAPCWRSYGTGLVQNLIIQAKDFHYGKT